MPFVYFIQAGDEDGPIKIGFADNPRARLNDLQTGHYEQLVLLGVLPCETLEDERKIHALVDDACIRGEWHRATYAVLDLVAQSSHLDDLLPEAPRRPVKTLTPRPRYQPTEEERIRILAAISTTPNLIHAARSLGFSRRTLQNRMRALKIPPGKGGAPVVLKTVG